MWLVMKVTFIMFIVLWECIQKIRELPKIKQFPHDLQLVHRYYEILEMRGLFVTSNLCVSLTEYILKIDVHESGAS